MLVSHNEQVILFSLKMIKLISVLMVTENFTELSNWEDFIKEDAKLFESRFRFAL